MRTPREANEHAQLVAAAKARTAGLPTPRREGPYTIHREGVLRGIPWQIVSGVTPGYRWRVQVPVDHLGGRRWQESGGAFYDGADDHPEGGVAWAVAALHKFLAMSVEG